MKKLIALSLACTLAGLAPAIASDKPGHGGMSHGSTGHGSMDHGKMEMKGDSDEADAKAVINSIDVDGGKINVTHEPVEALGWPKMTMDLPVTRRVDLSAVKTGEPVTIRIKQGRDKQFRVIEITPAE